MPKTQINLDYNSNFKFIIMEEKDLLAELVARGVISDAESFKSLSLAQLTNLYENSTPKKDSVSDSVSEVAPEDNPAVVEKAVQKLIAEGKVDEKIKEHYSAAIVKAREAEQKYRLLVQNSKDRIKALASLYNV